MDYSKIYFILDSLIKTFIIKYYYKGFCNINGIILNNKNLYHFPNIILFTTKIISLESNNIKKIPEDLPNGIESIILNNNNINFIHHNLPFSLKRLWIFDNPIYMISNRFYKIKLKGVDIEDLNLNNTNLFTLQIIGLNDIQIKRCQKVYKLMILIKKTWIVIQLQRKYKNYLYSPKSKYGKKLIENGENNLQEFA